MATLLSFLLILLHLFSAEALSANVPSPAATIHHACTLTAFPQICITSLQQHLSPNPNATEIIRAAVAVSAANLPRLRTMVEDILASSAGNVNRTLAATNALKSVRNSIYRTGSTALALGSADSPADLADARAWLTASLTYLSGSLSGLSGLGPSPQVVGAVAFLNQTISLTGNALRMIAAFAVYGGDVSTWAPLRTERQGFWEAARAGAGFKAVGIPAGLTADATVCGTAGCSHRTVQAAVDAAPANGSRRFVIHIKQGVYNETVRVELGKTNLVFLGDGAGKTVVTGALSVGGGIPTTNTPTIAVLGDGFMMSKVTVENTAGSDGGQAVALRSDSDRSIIEDCEFLGNQDTLYVGSLRQYYKNCRIVGNVDFIFGNAAAVFHGCTVLVRPRTSVPGRGESNAVTAQGRIDPAQSTGMVFDGCVVNGTEEYMGLYEQNPKVHKNYLGRPWRTYSRAVFINTYMGALIHSDGWLPWDGDLGLSTLYYGELRNSGPGAGLAGRVNWSSAIPPEHAAAYSLEAFIQGDQWIPADFS